MPLKIFTKSLQDKNCKKSKSKKSSSKVRSILKSITKGKFGPLISKLKSNFNKEQSNDYIVLKPLNNTNGATVLLVENERTGKVYVQKVFKNPAYYITELKMMLKIGEHENIILFIECLDSNILGKSLIYDFANGGDLCSEIVSHGTLIKCNALTIMVQIFNAVSFIHSKSIIHRDIKLENIVCYKHNDILLKVKLIDFGLSIFYDKKNPAVCLVGTVGYIAPEIYLYEPQTFAVDIWSCAIVMIIVCTGHHPLNPNVLKGDEIKNITINGEIDLTTVQSSDSFFAAFIKRMLIKNPKKRPLSIDLMNSLKNYYFSKSLQTQE